MKNLPQELVALNPLQELSVCPNVEKHWFKAVFLKVGSLEQQPQNHLGSCWKRKSGSDVLNENPWGDGQWERQSR